MTQSMSCDLPSAIKGWLALGPGTTSPSYRSAFCVSVFWNTNQRLVGKCFVLGSPLQKSYSLPFCSVERSQKLLCLSSVFNMSKRGLALNAARAEKRRRVLDVLADDEGVHGVAALLGVAGDGDGATCPLEVMSGPHEVSPTVGQSSRQLSARDKASLGKASLKMILSKHLLSDDPLIVAEAANTLHEFLQKLTSQMEAFRYGVHYGLIALMKRWKEEKEVQCSVIQCVGNGVYQDKAVLLAMFEMGVIEMIVAAMKNFANVELLQRFSIGAIANLLSEKNTVSEATAALFVDQLGGLRIAVDAMNKYPKNRKLQSNACFMLKTICKLGKYREQASQAGALIAASAAVTSFPDDTEIRRHTAHFMNFVLMEE